MIIELGILQNDDLGDVDEIHRRLRPGLDHLEQGGTVTVCYQGRVLGTASSAVRLYQLAIGSPEADSGSECAE